MTKILVVDDEKDIRDIIRGYLEFEGFDFAEAADGMEALAILEKEDFDLIVLDIMMPKLDGMTVLRELRKTKNTPVILLSARGEEYDKLFGFEIGTDDYIVKPFSPKELVARIKTILKRNAAGKDGVELERLAFDQLIIDISGRNVFIDDKKISLTPKEFDLLLCLCKNRNVVLSRNQILSEVWGFDFFGDDRTVDTHIKMLRGNIGRYREHIKTIWGIGYKFEF